MGPLILITGDAGARILGISRKVRVADAVEGGNWKIRIARGLNLRELLIQIQQTPILNIEAGDDRILWLQEPEKYENKFSTRRTWELTRTHLQSVSWHMIVWFPQAILRHSFILWLAFRNRLSTGDRIRKWGETQSCLLCGETNETRDHLFFACPYSYTVWTMLLSTLLSHRINPDWNLTVNSILRNRLSKVDRMLVKMVFQSTVYWIWRERNGRRHQKPHNTPLSLGRTIHKDIQHRLLSRRRTPTEDDKADDVDIQWSEVPKFHALVIIVSRQRHIGFWI